MAELAQLDRIYHFIMESFVRTGQAPHFIEIARNLSMAPEEARKLLHELMGSGIPGWLYPDSDSITSFAPFNNLPTHYRIAVEGQQNWFGQGALESLAVCWLFPGKDVAIENFCLDCGESIRVVVRDGIIESDEPPGICGYVDIPFRDWRKNFPYTGSRINFFRSEEHVRKWSGFKKEAEGGLLSLTDMMAIMSAPYFRERLNGRYISSFSSRRQEWIESLREITRGNPFWRVSGAHPA